MAILLTFCAEATASIAWDGQRSNLVVRQDIILADSRIHRRWSSISTTSWCRIVCHGGAKSGYCDWLIGLSDGGGAAGCRNYSRDIDKGLKWIIDLA
jgi:hypothetical protein